ncbi:uncharacterized protein RHO25_008064 [Cercospora beticola]|uniref:Uncharacterized protein n=1 Tax=Cercospora beticola TaxID=122368 RepID=A0ABZ0NV59_CERBT|nr:hypothetical protein RHO25_008064 [Cercospora beticola]
MADARKSGTIALYNDPHWNSEKHVLSIQDYAKGERHTIPPQFNDKATWVAWNLPVGTVVTVANHHKPRDSGKSVGNLDGKQEYSERHAEHSF